MSENTDIQEISFAILGSETPLLENQNDLEVQQGATAQQPSIRIHVGASVLACLTAVAG